MIEVEFTKGNPPWFTTYRSHRDIHMITDFKGGLLRADATHSKHKAPNLKERYTR